MPIPRAYRNAANAPWNDPPAPECMDCLETIRDIRDHEEWCENQVDPETLHEQHAEDAMHVEYDPMEH